MVAVRADDGSDQRSPLVDAGSELRLLAPGDSYRAAFSITVIGNAG